MTQPSPLSHRRRALIVDDDFSIAMGLKADLQALGFDVCDLATNRQEAFRLAMSDQPDVVLMDVCLAGGRKGIEAARWLREVCEVRIIFVTEYRDRDTLERIHKQVPGASVLHKPVSRQGLFDAVAELSHFGGSQLDRKAQCPGVEAGGGQIKDCLKTHIKDLSDDCKAVLVKVVNAKACADDAKKFCSDVKADGGTLEACMKSHIHEVSDACKVAMVNSAAGG